MTRIFLIPCVVFVFLTAANAGEFYKCIDRDGNTIITNSPQSGMKKCVLKTSDIDPSPQERAQEQRERAAQKQKYQQQEEQQQQEQQKEKAEIKCHTEQGVGILVGNGPAVIPGASYRICRDKNGKLVSKERL